MNYMHYKSTRGGERKTFADILSRGLAADGGLYEPTSWPHHRRLRSFLSSNPTFPDVVGAVVGVFAGRRSLTHLDFTAIARKAFAPFHSRAVVPLREVEHNLWLLELFHGPTLSFKDIPLQFYGQLLEALASERKRLLIMIGATSGDTGSAAIEAMKPVRGVRLFMLHPKDRISALQRKQMTCVQSPNICNIAVDGSYDDCLRLVKAAAQSEAINARGQVSAVNSFNWVRIAVQSAIYLYAAQQIPRRAKSVRFALASGNFGNAYAGYVAKKLGAKIEGLTLAVGHNDFLHNLFQQGSAKSGKVVPSLAPSIDIMTPNNVERLLFRSLADSARKWSKVREQAEESGTLRVPKGALRSEIFRFFRTQRFDDEQILEAMSQAYNSVGEPLDPHSAIALKAAKDASGEEDKKAKNKKARNKKARDLCTIALATASAAKFPETLERAIGARPHMPLRLAELETRAEEYETIAADFGALESIIVARLQKPLDSDASIQATSVQAASVQATSVQAASVQSDSVQPASVQAASVQAASVQAASVQAASVQAASVQPASVQPASVQAAEGLAATAATAAATAPIATEAVASETTTEATLEEGEKHDGVERADETTSDEHFARMPEKMSEANLAMGASAALFSSAQPPEMPAVAAMTEEEDSLEKKIAKLKEQTAQLDDSFDASATTSSSSLPSDSFTTPAATTPSPTPALEDAPRVSDPFAIPLPAQQEDEQTDFPAKTETTETETTMETMGGEGAGDDGMVSLADAAEQGQASLQEKIAKLKEQSEKLDEVTETVYSPFEEAKEETSEIAGAENFFSQPTPTAKNETEDSEEKT